MNLKPKQLNDPYEQCDKTNTNWRRLNVDLPDYDFNAIASLMPSRGTISATTRILWKKLVLGCTREGITTYNDADRFADYLNNCYLERGDAVSGPSTPTPVGDVGTGTPGLRPSDQSSTNSIPDVSSEGKSKGRKLTGQSTKRKVNSR